MRARAYLSINRRYFFSERGGDAVWCGVFEQCSFEIYHIFVIIDIIIITIIIDIILIIILIIILLIIINHG